MQGRRILRGYATEIRASHLVSVIFLLVVFVTIGRKCSQEKMVETTYVPVSATLHPIRESTPDEKLVTKSKAELLKCSDMKGRIIFTTEPETHSSRLICKRMTSIP